MSHVSLMKNLYAHCAVLLDVYKPVKIPLFAFKFTGFYLNQNKNDGHTAGMKLPAFTASLMIAIVQTN